MSLRVLLILAAVLVAIGIGLGLLPATAPAMVLAAPGDGVDNLVDLQRELPWPEARLIPNGIIVPLEPEIAQQAPPPPPEPRLTLLGITRNGGASYAWVSVNDEPAQRLAIGDTIGRWRVAAIDPVALNLEDGEEQNSLTLFGRQN